MVDVEIEVDVVEFHGVAGQFWMAGSNSVDGGCTVCGGFAALCLDGPSMQRIQCVIGAVTIETHRDPILRPSYDLTWTRVTLRKQLTRSASGLMKNYTLTFVNEGDKPPKTRPP